MIKDYRSFNEEFIKSGLDLRIGIESEHKDLYDFLSSKVDMPITSYEFYKKIAEAHLKELPDYYTRLKKMEEE